MALCGIIIIMLTQNIITINNSFVSNSYNYDFKVISFHLFLNP